MTFADIIVLLSVITGVCWYFCTRRQKPKPHRYTRDAGTDADETQK